jgi:hypothetical protein
LVLAILKGGNRQQAKIASGLKKAGPDGRFLNIIKKTGCSTNNTQPYTKRTSPFGMISIHQKERFSLLYRHEVPVFSIIKGILRPFHA